MYTYSNPVSAIPTYAFFVLIVGVGIWAVWNRAVEFRHRPPRRRVSRGRSKASPVRSKRRSAGYGQEHPQRSKKRRREPMAPSGAPSYGYPPPQDPYMHHREMGGRYSGYSGPDTVWDPYATEVHDPFDGTRAR